MNGNVIKFSKKNLGVILIEFAFAIPIFLVLIYYLHDLPKMRLMQRKMQFVAYEMASILQNIADQKSGTESPAITAFDIAAAARIAYLSIYFGNTMNSKSGTDIDYPIGHFPYVGIYLLKGTNSNAIKKLWDFRFHGGAIYNVSSVLSYNLWCNSVNPNSSTASGFHPSLTIVSGENKIVLDCCLFYYWNNADRKFADGRICAQVPTRSAFGFLFVNPKGVGSEKRGFFSAVATFTPPPQAFSESLPPQ